MMRQRLLWAGALLALVLPIWASMPWGIPEFSDGVLHLHRIVSASVNLQEGMYPRWTPYLHHGFGYPMHNFYSPMVYLMGAGLMILTPLSALMSFNLLMAMGLALYPVGAYLWARTMTGRTASLVAGAFYLYAPFRLREVWVQANLPQLWAMALMPLVLWALYHAVTTRQGRWMSATGALFALLIMTHHLTAFLFAPVLGLYGLYLLWYRGRGVLLPLIIAIGSGVALATIYWLPTLGELNQTQIDTIQDSAYSISANFVPLDTLLAPTAPIDRAHYNWSGIEGTYGARIGQAQLIVVLVMLPGILLWWRYRQNHERLLITGAWVVIALCILLMLEVSAPLWDSLPLIGYVQFPWRLLGVVLLMIVPLVAYLVQTVGEGLRPYVATGIIALSFAFILPMLYAPSSLEVVPDNPTPADTIEYERLSGNLGLSASNEYLPIDARERPIYGLFVRDITAPQPRIERYNMDGWWFDIDENTIFPEDTQITSERLRAGMRWQIATPQAFTLIVHQMNFAGWQATLNGEALTITSTQPHGLISIDVPAGEHRLEIVYAGSTLQNIATLISMIGLAGLLGVAFFMRGDALSQNNITHAPTDNHTDAPTMRPLLPVTIIGACVIFALVQALWLLPHTELFRPHSAPDKPPAQYLTEHIFGERIALVGYDTPLVARAGDTIKVTVYWRALQALDTVYGSSLMLTTSLGVSFAGANNYRMAGVDTSFLDGTQYIVERHTLSIREDAPPFVLNLDAAVYISGDAGRFNYLQTDGSNKANLAQVRLTGDWRQHADASLNPSDIRLGDAVTLVGWAWVEEPDDGLGDAPREEEVCLLVRWRAERDNLPEVAVMLHWRDAAGATIGVNDTAPFDNTYPTSLWQAGQILDDTYCFLRPIDAHALLIGMYGRDDGVRLSAITPASDRLPEDAFVIE